MLKNNNMSIVHRMAAKSLKSHKRRNKTMLLAVLLSSFMLFCVFTIGVTYFKMLRLQNIRLSGAEFDAIMYGATEQQIDLLQSHPDVEDFGMASLSGYVEETPYDQTPNVVLIYADPVYWDKMMAPARESVTGVYPTEEDQVMVTKDALEKCGCPDLKIGDHIPLTYSIKGEMHETSFRISGFWDGYGDKDVFYVSEKFYSQTGLQYADVASGRCHINFKTQIMSSAKQDAFIESMELDKRQSLFFMAETGYSVQILTGIVCLTLVICLCAYLLIYNILYLSIAGNIRYYGLLQTLGMTGRQIYGLVRRQMLLIGGIGLGSGMILGSALSFFLIPGIIKSLRIEASKIGGIEISFHPAIFLLTVLLVGITIFTASQKPAKIAVMCSPIEALGYRPVFGVKKKPQSAARTNYSAAHHSRNLVWRMAIEQITKDKKKAWIVMLSLASSLVVFLCMVTLIHSQSAREYVYNYRNLDLVLRNDTVRRENIEEHVQIFDENFFDKLMALNGIDEIAPVLYTEITVPWDVDFADQWMREFYETWMDIAYEDDLAEYQEHPENFGSVLVGITAEDFKALNEEMSNSIDETDFLGGKTCVLYRNNLSFENQDVAGKTVTCAEYGRPENTRTFDIAGLTDISDYNALLGYPPVIIVSDHVLKDFVENPVIYKIGISYAKEYDEAAENAVLSIADEIPQAKDYSYESKIELMKNVKKAQGNLMEAGISIVLILALIGLMNYVNTFVGSIQSRQMELSIMESIGMTDRQKTRMLAMEGIFYAVGAWLITMTAGLGITYYLFQSQNYMDAAFKLPLLPLFAAIGLTFLICALVPVIACRQAEKGRAVAERIKGIE